MIKRETEELVIIVSGPSSATREIVVNTYLHNYSETSNGLMFLDRDISDVKTALETFPKALCVFIMPPDSKLLSDCYEDIRAISDCGYIIMYEEGKLDNAVATLNDIIESAYSCVDRSRFDISQLEDERIPSKAPEDEKTLVCRGGEAK